MNTVKTQYDVYRRPVETFGQFETETGDVRGLGIGAGRYMGFIRMVARRRKNG